MYIWSRGCGRCNPSEDSYKHSGNYFVIVESNCHKIACTVKNLETTYMHFSLFCKWVTRISVNLAIQKINIFKKLKILRLKFLCFWKRLKSWEGFSVHALSDYMNHIGFYINFTIFKKPRILKVLKNVKSQEGLKQKSFSSFKSKTREGLK